jgi:hypothetical protein
MGHSKVEKAKTHKRIVAIASKRFREEGLAGVGIADLRRRLGQRRRPRRNTAILRHDIDSANS